MRIPRELPMRTTRARTVCSMKKRPSCNYSVLPNAEGLNGRGKSESRPPVAGTNDLFSRNLGSNGPCNRMAARAGRPASAGSAVGLRAALPGLVPGSGSLGPMLFHVSSEQGVDPRLIPAPLPPKPIQNVAVQPQRQLFLSSRLDAASDDSPGKHLGRDLGHVRQIDVAILHAVETVRVSLRFVRSSFSLHYRWPFSPK